MVSNVVLRHMTRFKMSQLTDKALRDLRPREYFKNAQITFNELGWVEEANFMSMMSECYVNNEIEKIEYVIVKLRYNRPNM